MWPQIDDGFSDVWPRGPDHPHDVATNTELDELLNKALCWDEADHRLLVLWGHGERAVPTPLRDAEVPAAETVLHALADHRPPDIIGYDACWMATLHTVITLAEWHARRGVFIGRWSPSRSADGPMPS